MKLLDFFTFRGRRRALKLYAEGVWLNWLLLGTCLSNLRRSDEPWPHITGRCNATVRTHRSSTSIAPCRETGRRRDRLPAREIRLERGDDPAAVRAFAIDIWRDTHRENLLWLIRQAPRKISPAAQYFRLRIIGTFPRGTFEGVDADAF